MSKRTRRRVLASKIEVTEGTLQTFAAADADLLIIDPKFEADIPMYKREILDASMSGFADIPGTSKATISFRTEVKGSGTAGTAPKVGRLLRACGWSETLVALTSATYKPYSGDDSPSISMGIYEDGLRKQIRGARGSVKYSSRIGEPGMFEFSFTGVYAGVSDIAILAGTGIETTIPKQLLNAAFAVHGYAAKVSAISWDMANALEMRGDVNDPEGFISCLIGARDFKGSIDPEEVAVATMDWYGRWKNGDLGNLTWKHPGAVGNIVTFTAPKVQFAKHSEAARGVLAALSTDFNIKRDVAAGDDEMTIVFT